MQDITVTAGGPVPMGDVLQVGEAEGEPIPFTLVCTPAEAREIEGGEAPSPDPETEAAPSRAPSIRLFRRPTAWDPRNPHRP